MYNCCLFLTNLLWRNEYETNFIRTFEHLSRILMRCNRDGCLLPGY